MGFFRLFGEASHKREDDDIVRIDLDDRLYGFLMRSLEHDDIAATTTEVYVTARLKRDGKGYFLRLPYTEAQLVYGMLRVVWEKASKQRLQDAKTWADSLTRAKEGADNEQRQSMDALVKFQEASEQEGDLRELLEAFQYQLCPEEYHPFGPR